MNGKGINPKLIKEVKIKSAFRCCVCKCTANSVCLIYPEKEVILTNLINFCEDCKDLFSENPQKRKKLVMLRNHWWDLVKDNDKTSKSKNYVQVSPELKRYNILTEGKCILNINSEDHFNSIKYGLVCNTIKMQKLYPNYLRGFELEIEGHLEKDNTYDKDIQKILFDFIPYQLIKYITEIHTPLYSYINPNDQVNEIPPIEKWEIE